MKKNPWESAPVPAQIIRTICEIYRNKMEQEKCFSTNSTKTSVYILHKTQKKLLTTSYTCAIIRTEARQMIHGGAYERRSECASWNIAKPQGMFSLARLCILGSNIVAIDFCSYLSFSHCFNGTVPIPSGVGTVPFYIYAGIMIKAPVLFSARAGRGQALFLCEKSKGNTAQRLCDRCIVKFFVR